MNRIVNSKLTALAMGVWITYCLAVGSLGGAVFLLFFYLLMLRSYGNKNASAGDTSAKKIIAFRRRLYHE